MKVLVPAYAVFTLLCVWGAAATGYYFVAGAPLLLLGIWVAVVDFSLLFWALIALIPFSTEVNLPGGFGTDMPTEPLIVGLMFIFGLYLLQRLPQSKSGIWRQPMFIILVLHLAWIVLSTVFSDLLFVSVKFTLAKIWYFVTFYLLGIHLMSHPDGVHRFFRIFLTATVLLMCITMLRHGLLGFSFMGIHSVMHPFQRNHVSYSAILAAFVPYVALMLPKWKADRGGNKRLWGILLLFLVAIYFSYTRAAYIALFIALGAYFIVEWRLMRYAIGATLVVVVVWVVSLVQHDRYLNYAPNFETTISHEKFDNLIEATYKMEDISTMERLYRWVAGGHMAPERPLLGWGPGNFVNFYKAFTVSDFTTYVSDNPEQSGVHNYFLMTLVEQGFPGLIIFISLLVVFFMRGERLYHRLAIEPERQRLVIMAMLSNVVITAFLLINDLIETDKVGSLFFLNLAIVTGQELYLAKKNTVDAEVK